MLRTADIVMILMMTAAATVTYSIKHRAELKLAEVHRIESDIKLEKDTIDLLKADWALLTQPNRLKRLIDAYQADLALVPTISTQLARPNELPMMKADVPPPPEPKDGKKKGQALASAAKKTGSGSAGGDSIEAIIAGTASAKAAPAPATAPAPVAAAQPAPAPDDPEETGVMNETDDMSTGSVEQ